MTVKQLHAKAEVARKQGVAFLQTGDALHFWKWGAREEWSLVDPAGNVVTVVSNPKELEFICD